MNKKEKESYKRYQKFNQEWVKLMATKYKGKGKLPKVLTEVAISMGYKKKYVDFVSGYVFKNFSQSYGDIDMIFFRILDNIKVVKLS